MPLLKLESEQVLGGRDLGVFDKVVLALNFMFGDQVAVIPD